MTRCLLQGVRSLTLMVVMSLGAVPVAPAEELVRFLLTSYIPPDTDLQWINAYLFVPDDGLPQRIFTFPAVDPLGNYTFSYIWEYTVPNSLTPGEHTAEFFVQSLDTAGNATPGVGTGTPGDPATAMFSVGAVVNGPPQVTITCSPAPCTLSIVSTP